MSKKTAGIIGVCAIIIMFLFLSPMTTNAITLKSGSTLTVNSVNGMSILSGLPAGANVKDILYNFDDTSAAVYSKDGVLLDDNATAATGQTVKSADCTLNIVIKGDIDGNGAININDYLAIKLHLAAKSVLTGSCFQAADVNSSSSVTVTDYLQIKRYLSKTYNIVPVFTNENITNTEKRNTLYQLPSKTSQQSMCYVIRTKNDKTIVIDSGNRGDATYVLDFLKTVTKQQTPHIDAWFFTHIHADHTNAFFVITDTNSAAVKVDKLYYNFPSAQWLTERDMGLTAYDNFFASVAKHTEAQTVIMKDGDKYEYDGIVFDILLTHEAGYAITSDYINNTSTVMNMTLDGQNVLFLGDAAVDEGKYLLSKYGAKLKSVFVQMAHHGQGGVDKDVYQAIAPTACLWTAPAWLYNNTSGLYKTLIVRQWMEELGVKYHFIDKDGLQTITFPYTFAQAGEKNYISTNESGIVYSLDTQEKYNAFITDCYSSAQSFKAKSFENGAAKLEFNASIDPYFIFNLASPINFADYPVLAVYSKYALTDSLGAAYTHSTETFFTDIRPCAALGGGTIIMREAAYVTTANASTYQLKIYDYSDDTVYKDIAYTPFGTIKSIRYDPAADVLGAVNTTVSIKYIGFFKTVAAAQDL